MSKNFLFKLFIVCTQVAIVSFLWMNHSKDSQSQQQACTVVSDKALTQEHIEFVELLAILQDKRPTSLPHEGLPSMRNCATSESKVQWHQRLIDSIDLDFYPFRRQDQGRSGEVYISLDGVPSNLSLDTILKPAPWHIYLFGTNIHLMYDIFLTTEISLEAYHDYGKYLQEKKLAKALPELEGNEFGCHSKWYEVTFPAANGKWHNPFWMGVYEDLGNQSGSILIEITVAKPEKNPFFCDEDKLKTDDDRLPI